MTSQPLPVTVLLASFDGARFLPAQLESLARQSYPHWRLVVSDDGSADGTRDLVRQFAADRPDRKVTLIDGPRRGSTANFLHLLGALREGEALAFCDQDDVWLPDRLARGVAAVTAARDEDRPSIPAFDDTRARAAEAISGAASNHNVGPHGRVAYRWRAAPDDKAAVETPHSVAHPPSAFATVESGAGEATPSPSDAPPDRPILHVSRTMICDEDLRQLGPAPLYTRRPAFLNALVQACTPGNTMLVDPLGAAILRRAAPAAAAAGVVSHDWWSYLVISGCGGDVIRDPALSVLYRQHRGNVMGRNDTPRAMLARLARLGAGDFGDWLRANVAALSDESVPLTAQNRARLGRFAAAIEASGPRAALELARLGVYRQTRAGSAALFAAALAGRLADRAR